MLAREFKPCRCIIRSPEAYRSIDRAFVALKYAPEQMAKTDGASGKLTGGGSIILTASGE